MENNQQKLNIKAADRDLKGRSANNAMISHTKEEFVLDFINMLPPHPLLVSRIIISPGHAKRFHRALTEQIERYEGSFGKLEDGEHNKPNIGFQNN
ncbi:MAG: DUF3467 domain-containing protein [Candidatus Ryanbacteria bacterium CG10_big_fil_rev_8_21_14_0_10_43_42]|uniref:DUF3467 domain-containing protein n=1 Tax=Candidatus Ryanbacteria bacterium CG10_big_fil_rev_8_21_14_0_10_43_42 TaxID=1974864 RepID=A0A2M8KWQ6_9BACT|nr:MAG: DUF3467 domain-containing protein [Candidatus Ryanbacteria bacterium CG10_big_fil_rev_8_21_14_0_10_43_42]